MVDGWKFRERDQLIDKMNFNGLMGVTAYNHMLPHDVMWEVHYKSWQLHHYIYKVLHNIHSYPNG